MEGAIRKVLVATDLSEISDQLVAVGGQLVRQGSGELSIIHVTGGEEYEDLRRGARENQVALPLDQYLNNLRAAVWYAIERVLGESMPAQVEIAMRTGSVADEILTSANRIRADVIVMGTHGRTGLRRILLGSVAEEVLRRALCPVLIVPMTAARVPTEEPVRANLAFAG